MITTMLPWGKISLLDSTRISEAAVSFQEELHSLPPAKPAFRFAVSSQLMISF
jgi:hypothetical protein